MPALIQFVRYICVTRAEKKTRLSFFLFDTRPINLLEIISASVPTGKTNSLSSLQYFHAEFGIKINSNTTPSQALTSLITFYPGVSCFSGFVVLVAVICSSPAATPALPEQLWTSSCSACGPSSAGTCTGPAGHTDTSPCCQMQLKIFINV